MRRELPPLALISCVAASIFSAPLQGQSANATLKPGDVVKITVWDNPALSGEFTVAADSTLNHPLYKQVKLGGVPLPMVTGEIETFLKTLQREPRVAVEPLIRVMVSGEVRAPNLYTLPPTSSIAEAVTRAGGATEAGRLDRVILVRDGSRRMIDLETSGPTDGGMLIQSGDQIILGRRRNMLRDYIGPIASVAASIAAFVNLARH